MNKSHSWRYVIVSLVFIVGDIRSAIATTDVVNASRLIGITPESIVLANLQESAGPILARLDAASESIVHLESLHQQALTSAKTAQDILNELVDDPVDETLQEQYALAVSNLHTLRAGIDSATETLFDNITNELNAENVGSLENWQQGSQYNVPAEFRVLVRTDDEWKGIEFALRTEARIARRGTDDLNEDELDEVQEIAALLAAIRTDADVIAARVRLDTHLATVEQTFANAQNESED